MNIIETKKMTDFNHLNLFSIKYQDRIGNPKSWIFASRSEIPDVMNADKKLNEIELNETNIDKTKNTANQAPHAMNQKPHAVVLVPFHQEYQKLVIIKEFRVPLGDYQYGFPAGLMDKGEQIEETAARELREETGLDITSVIRTSPVIYSSSGMTDESIALVYVNCTGTPSVKWNEDSEDITVLMVSSKDAQELVSTPGIKFDVKSWIVLSTFARTGKI
ncbi:MAG: NUDIX hydrolase [Desulfamplus sp.]|nr:NUDIX hydrolase [Desulfamplus sp.]